MLNQESELLGAAEIIGPPGAPPAVASELAPPAGKERRRKLQPQAVQYLGFRISTAGREYSLRVTGGLGPRLFVVLIAHEVFAAGEARFQDAPDLCFARLQRDLEAEPDLLPGPLLALTAQELLAYRAAREKRPAGRR